MPRTLSGSARGPLWPCIASGRRWDLPAASPGSCRASKVSSCAARHRRGLPSGVRPAGFSSPCWFLWGVSSPSPIAMLLRTLARPAPGGRLPNHRPGGPATSRERGPVGSCCVSCCFLLLTNIGGRAPCVKPTMIRFRSLTCNDAAFEKKSKILYAEGPAPVIPGRALRSFSCRLPGVAAPAGVVAPVPEPRAAVQGGEHSSSGKERLPCAHVLTGGRTRRCAVVQVPETTDILDQFRPDQDCDRDSVPGRQELRIEWLPLTVGERVRPVCSVGESDGEVRIYQVCAGDLRALQQESDVVVQKSIV